VTGSYSHDYSFYWTAPTALTGTITYDAQVKNASTGTLEAVSGCQDTGLACNIDTYDLVTDFKLEASVTSLEFYVIATSNDSQSTT
jgi:hypothetical protein